MHRPSPYRRRALQLALTAAAVGSTLAFALPHHGSAAHLPLGSLGPEGVPIPSAPLLAAAASPAPGQSVDGISCAPLEQLAFHIHAHLTVFVDGAARQIPRGVGISDPQSIGTPHGPFVVSGACFSWLHTHAADGIVHMESPIQRGFTLGNFFDVWGEPLTADRVATATGHVTAFVDGRPYLGNPRTIPLFAHAQVQLDVGRPLVQPDSIVFPNGL
jgi:hypothetical protein